MTDALSARLPKPVLHLTLLESPAPLAADRVVPAAPAPESARARLAAPATAAARTHPVTSAAWARSKLRIRRAADAAAILVATAAAVPLGTIVFGPAAPDRQEVLVAAILAATWFVALRIRRAPEVRTIGDGAGVDRATVATLTVFALLAVAHSFVPFDGVKALILFGLPLGLGLIATSRLLGQHRLSAQRAAGLSLPRALVVGSARDVHFVLDHLGRSRTPAYTVASVVYSDAVPGSDSMAPAGYPAFGGVESIAAAVALVDVDVVIVASEPGDGGEFVRALAWHLESSRTELALAWTLESVDAYRIRVDSGLGFPLMHVEKPTYSGGKHRLKRLFDVLVSGFAILMLAPLLGLLALLIKTDSAGPVFFRQERIGRDGTTFSMMKFRSMVVTAEADLADLMARNEGNGLLFKMRSDPRVTRVGTVLRRYSLDELPQLWNIFVGDMSIVGPRPPLAREVQEYEDHVHRRLFVKPGLTGLWQVSGRSDLSWDESVRLDLHYVENWSLAGDLRIIARTVGVVVKPVGAY